MNKRKLNKKFWSLSIIVLMVGSLILSACSQSNNTGNTNDPAGSSPSGSDEEMSQTEKSPYLVSEEPISFKWLLQDLAEAPVRDDWQIFDEIFKRTNVKVEFEPVPQEGIDEKIKILLATNSVPDFMTLAAKDARQFGSEGVFLNLNDYMEHAPNIQKYFEEYPEAKGMATGDDGGTYMVPKLEGLGFNYTWIARQDLLTQYDLEAPTNPDEFYQLLKELKSKHPDSYPFITRNGVKTFTTIFTRIFTGLEPYMPSYLGFISWDPEQGEFVFAPDHPGFQESLEYMRKLYSEGLVDPEVFILTLPQWTERLLTGKSFLTYDWKTRNEAFTDQAAEAGLISGYEMNAIPLFAAEGINDYELSRAVIAEGGLAISSKVEDKVAAVKFLDYLVSEEGSDLLALGIEGETYSIENDEPKYLSELGPAPYDLLRGQWGVWYPSISLDFDKSRKAERLSEKAQTIEDMYMPNIIPGPGTIILNTEEDQFQRDHMDNLRIYMEEKITEFVAGKTPINENSMKEFVDQSVKLKAYELRDMYNTAYQRAYGK